jgi:hypothetical protein
MVKYGAIRWEPGGSDNVILLVEEKTAKVIAYVKYDYVYGYYCSQAREYKESDSYILADGVLDYVTRVLHMKSPPPLPEDFCNLRTKQLAKNAGIGIERKASPIT